MTITPIAFLLVFFGGLAAAFFSAAKYGLFTYLFVFHVSPAHSWWGDSVPDLRYLMLAAVTAIVAAFVRRDPHPDESWYSQRLLLIILAFNLWLWAINLWAISPLHMEGCTLFGKHFIISVVVYRIAKQDFEIFKQVCLVIVIGCAWFGWQTLGKGGRVEGVAGAISDANTLGMHCAAGLMVASMMVLGMRGVYRWAAFASAPLILNAIIISGSRGAFLGLLAGGVVAYLFCPAGLRVRFKGLAALGIVLFFMLAHQQFLERIGTLFESAFGESQEELDHSATSRIEIAGAGWQMALDHPLGTGFRGHAILSPLYLDDQYLTSAKRVSAEGGGRSAHNLIMAALVEFGFVGAALILFLYLVAAMALMSLRRRAQRRRDTDSSLFCALVASTLTVVFVAGQFTNYLHAEMQYWMFGLIAALGTMTARTEKCEQAKTTRTQATLHLSA